MSDDLEVAYERGLQQAALIGLCGGERREALAISFVENEFCDSPLEAITKINNAASQIISIDAMQVLLESPATGIEFDRSNQLRPLFKSLYRKTVMMLSSAKSEEEVAQELQREYDFPQLILEHFVKIVEKSLSPDLDYEE